MKSFKRWWKIDLHTHTPASSDYENKDISPDDWLKSAMDSGLDAVVVSDHNSSEWIDKLKNEYLRLKQDNPIWFKPLIIFPGVEITVQESGKRIHLLAILDVNSTSQNIAALLGSCGINDDFGNAELSSTIKSLNDCIDNIKSADGLIIAAHVDTEAGLFFNKPPLNNNLKQIIKKLDAFELKNTDFFEKEENKKYKGLLNTKAIVFSSDAHSLDKIGSSYVWIRLGQTANLEALKFAFSEPDYFIKKPGQNPNILPDFFLDCIGIENLKYCGRNEPLKIELTPYYNSVIGGRGTGKSTFLESTRLVMNQEKQLDDEILEKYKKFKENVILENSKISAIYRRRNEIYRITWQEKENQRFIEKKTESGWEEEDAGDINQRFPVSIYSQKQIHYLANNTDGILSLIDASPEVNYKDWEQNFNSLKSKYFQIKERQREFNLQIENEDDLRTRLKDIENDLKHYEEKGYGDILKKHQKFSQQENSLPNETEFLEIIESIDTVVNDIGLSDFSEHFFNLESKDEQVIFQIYNETQDELKKVKKRLIDLSDEVKIIKKSFYDKINKSEWKEELNSIKEKYNRLKNEYEKKSGQINLETYSQWIIERNKISIKLSEIEKIKKEFYLAQKEEKEIFEIILKEREYLYKKRKNFLEKIIKDNKYISIDIIPFGNKENIEKNYRSILNINDNSFESSIYVRDQSRGLLKDLIDLSETKNNKDISLELIEKIKSDTKNILLGIGKFDNRFQQRLIKTFKENSAFFDELELWFPEDSLKIKFARDNTGREFENLENGSDGQKAAAILAFLLSYGEEPLFIDQPEDDLDNSLIYDLVVKQIKLNPTNRQIVIATHNANIVVNGNADKVFIMDFIKGQIYVKDSGALYESEIKNNICTIMEGGKEAFEKRYNRMNVL